MSEEMELSDRSQTEARGYDEMMAFGRVLYAQCEAEGAPGVPDLRVRENHLAEPESFLQAYVVLEMRGAATRNELDPITMSVLSGFTLKARVVPEDNQKGRHPEWLIKMPSYILDAYSWAVDEWGVPDPPRNWSADDRQTWTHENVVSSYRDATTDDVPEFEDWRTWNWVSTLE